MSAPILSIRNPEALDKALQHLNAGELVVVPTDTIYGIAVQPSRPSIVTRLYRVRDRTPEPALPFLLSATGKMAQVTRPNANATRLARHFWPGALSLILPPAANLPQELRAYPIAVRVPNFAPVLDLLDLAGGFLMITGAIRPGYPPAITAQEAAKLFGETTALILDGGPAPFGIPSTILNCIPDPPVIVRRGIISEEKIRQSLAAGKAGAKSP